MTDLTIFSFHDDQANKNRDIRTITDQDGEPWFVLKDVLDAMGSSTRPADAKASIEQGLGCEVVADYSIVDGLGRVYPAITAISR